MKISCNVVRDLLPLYHDGVCSDESRTLVEEHVRDCAECGRILKELRGEIEVPVEHADDLAPLEKIEKNVKKGKKRAWIKGAAAALAVVLIAFAGVNVWWYADTYSYYQRFAEGHEPVSGNVMDAQGNTVLYYETDENGKILGPVDEKLNSYLWSDGLYSFSVIVPRHPGEEGSVCVWKNKQDVTKNVTPGQVVDTWIASFGRGEYAYMVGLDITTRTQVPGQAHLKTEYTTEYVTLDADMNQIYADYMDEKTIAYQNAVYEEYCQEILSIVQAVQDQWPFLAE